MSSDHQTERSTSESEQDSTVYVVTYFNGYADDGFELGGVYSTEKAAEEAGEEQRCAEYGWEFHSVDERSVDSNCGGKR